ncbi:hypothetical protein [Mycolicibacterium sphagni]|uniref:DUF732 domain-containing protein n=1 Tax=Mycolicibacterium sphagni TaxID=1786 RepID=A0A255DK52_9MYCO|nr:hypothetical protein [Mycolicibacterium sphagni]MCV7176752.1 hypothetical protein [Mycolicibacterium sphagni]OYN77332.1 hypothetical protein CG716_19215 [Mycolicibacterium sphagni]
MITLSTVKKLAASTAVAGALSVAGLGLANGIAAAAPADHAGSGSGASTKSEHHSEVHAHLIPGFTPKPATGGGSEVHAHLIPGFAPKPTHTTTAPSLGSTDNGWGDGDACHEPRCVEVIDE